MKAFTRKIDIWNDCIAIRDTTTNSQVREKAIMLLNQMYTAGGKEIVRAEAEAFIRKNEHLFIVR
jgi:hypothetical protein